MEMDGNERRIMRLPEVLRVTGLSKSTLYRKKKLNQFPDSVELGERAVGWYAAVIFAWIESRPPTSK